MADNYTIKDIVENELCTGCGACVGESSNIPSMIWNDDGFLVPNIVGTVDDQSIKVCPFNPHPDPAVRDEDRLSVIFLPQSVKTDAKIGRYVDTYVGFSKRHREGSSSGGVSTYIFHELLSRGYVHRLFIVKEVNGSYEYQMFSDFAQITQISKTRYIPVTLERLFKLINEVEGKVAVSGVACFIKAIRLKQYYNPELKEKIPFLIGIICGGLKSSLYTDFLAQSAGIKGHYKSQEYRLKDFNKPASSYGFGAFDKDDVFHSMKMSKVGDMWGTGLFKANACDFCDDVTTELADISVGDAWIHPYRADGRGTNIIVTRSQLADQLIRDGISHGDLEVESLHKDKIIASQLASFKHRQHASKYRLDQAQKNGRLIPYKRERFFQEIPFEFKVVQNERKLLRALSIQLWKSSFNLVEFNQKLSTRRRKLKRVTKIYHIIQKIKRRLHVRTL